MICSGLNYVYREAVKATVNKVSHAAPPRTNHSPPRGSQRGHAPDRPSMARTSPGLQFTTRRVEKTSPGLVRTTRRVDTHPSNQTYARNIPVRSGRPINAFWLFCIIEVTKWCKNCVQFKKLITFATSSRKNGIRTSR